MVVGSTQKMNVKRNSGVLASSFSFSFSFHFIHILVAVSCWLLLIKRSLENFVFPSFENARDRCLQWFAVSQEVVLSVLKGCFPFGLTSPSSNPRTD